jgi:hypothetical protein
MIVKRRRAQSSPAAGAKEYIFLPDDMDAAGTFGKSPTAEVRRVLGLNSDSDVRFERKLRERPLLRLPRRDHQCWAYVGGCCARLGASYWPPT